MWACLPFCKHWRTGSCLGKVWRQQELWRFWSGHCETYNSRVTESVKTVSNCTSWEIFEEQGRAECSWSRQYPLTWLVLGLDTRIDGGTTECKWNCQSESIIMSLKNPQVIPPRFQYHKTSDISDRGYFSSLGPTVKKHGKKLQLMYYEHGTWEELSWFCQIQRCVDNLSLKNNLKWLIWLPLKITWVT